MLSCASRFHCYLNHFQARYRLSMFKKFILLAAVLFGIQSTSNCAEAQPEIVGFEQQLIEFNHFLKSRLVILKVEYYKLLTKTYKDEFKFDLESDATTYPEQTKQNISTLLNNHKEILWLYLTKQRLTHIVSCNNCFRYAYQAFLGQISSPNDIPYQYLNHTFFEILSQTSNRTDKKIQIMTTDKLKELTFYLYSETQRAIKRLAELCDRDKQFDNELTQALSDPTAKLSSSFFEKYLFTTPKESKPEDHAQIPQSIKNIITYALWIFEDPRVALILFPNFIDVDCMIQQIRTRIAIAKKIQYEKQGCE